MREKYRIITNQNGVHAELSRTIERHQQRAFSLPISEVERERFAAVLPLLQSAPLCLDLGCGTGMSSHVLGQQYPDHVVVGVDKSLHRLNRDRYFGADQSTSFVQIDNVILLRHDVFAFLVQLSHVSVKVEKTYLLYPNPWPKSSHLQRRWHGHGIFPQLCHLSGSLELRTNWQCYAEEFSQGLALLGRQGEVSPWLPVTPLTRFEQKYLRHSVPLFRVVSVV